MFLYNVHTPHKTFSLTHKEGEGFKGLVSRIAAKSGLSDAELRAFKEGKEGTGLVYEYEGERWSLEDDSDLSILLDRIPPSSSTGATLHLTPPTPHAHFASPTSPPAYSTASSTIKSKAQSKRSVSNGKASQGDRKTSAVGGSGEASGTDGPIVTSKDFATTSEGMKVPIAPKTTANGQSQPGGKLGTMRKVSKALTDIGKHETITGTTADGYNISRAKSVRSVMSTKSRKSKWGNDDAEPLGEVHKRKWLEFHANNGVRTVTGKVGEVDNVRMLLKSGYKQVYISRSFAVKAGLVPSKFGMGTFGYTGLKSIGNVPITVGGRTGHHQALVNEEQHFDVVLGRQWCEKMAVKIDPLDQTSVTYMDTGEVIPCDLVVLKDADGNVITVT